MRKKILMKKVNHIKNGISRTTFENVHLCETYTACHYSSQAPGENIKTL